MFCCFICGMFYLQLKWVVWSTETELLMCKTTPDVLVYIKKEKRSSYPLVYKQTPGTKYDWYTDKKNSNGHSEL